jgi:hypothetical protein
MVFSCTGVTSSDGLVGGDDGFGSKLPSAAPRRDSLVSSTREMTMLLYLYWDWPLGCLPNKASESSKTPHTELTRDICALFDQTSRLHSYWCLSSVSRVPVSIATFVKR